MPPPPVQYQTVTVPLVRGEATETDRRMRPAERLEAAENCRASELGGLSKRYGFSPISNTIEDGSAVISDHGPVRGLGRTSDELLAVGHRRLYAYNPVADEWSDRGPVSPCVGRRTERYRSHATYRTADLGKQGSYLLMAAHRVVDATSQPLVGDTHSIEFRGSTVDGDTTFAQVEVESAEGYTLSGGQTDVPFGPLVAPNGTAGLVAIFGFGRGGAAGELHRYSYDHTTPWVEPTAESDVVTADLWIDASSTEDPHIRTYDIVGLSDGYLVAFIDDTSQNINLRRYAEDHSLSASGTITPANAFYRVALSDSSGDNVYVLTVDSGGEGLLDTVLLYARNRSTLAAVWGPITLDSTITLAQAVDNLGVQEGEATSAVGTRVQCTWCVWQDGSALNRETRTRSTDTSGGHLDLLAATHHDVTVARPFFYRSRTYQHTMTAYVDDEARGFETHMVIDTRVYETDEPGALSPDPKMAAMYGVGQATGAEWALIGTCNHVVEIDSSTFAFFSPMIGEVGKVGATIPTTATDVRISQDEIRLEFDQPVVVQEVGRRCAIVCGGFVAWYDGTKTMELGFASPPWIHSLADSAGAAPPAGTYTYYCHWEAVDSAGYIHRSPPSAGESITTDTPSTINLLAESLPCSLREDGDMSCQWYRAGSDNIARRVNRTEELLANDSRSRLIETIRDSYGASSVSIPLYTTGGAIESVAPEGCRVAHVAREQLFLGDFFTRDRIQFSPFITPGTAGETALAPTLFESLGRILEKGERVTGISSMDSATVVFSDRSIYLLSGLPPDRTLRGDSMSRLTRVPVDDGCIDPRSVVAYPDGVMYQTSRGIYALTRSQGVTAIGEPVRAELDSYPVVTSAVLVPGERQVRFTARDAASSDGRVLVYDYRVGEWFVWHLQQRDASQNVTTTVPDGAAYVDGAYYLLDDAGIVWKEDSSTHYDDTDVWVTMALETADIQPAGPQQHMACREVVALLERDDHHGVSMSIAYDYADMPSAPEAMWSASVIDSMRDPDNREQLHRKPSRLRSQAVRVRIEDYEQVGFALNNDGTITVPWWLTFTSSSTGKTVQTSASTVSSGIGANVARSFSRDGVTFGWLLEPAAVNLITSQDLTTWTVSNTPVISSATAPDGSSGNWEVEDDNASAVEGLRLTGLASGTGAMTISSWVQQVGADGSSKVYGLGTPLLQIAVSAVDAAWTFRSDSDTLTAQVTEARLWPRESPASDTGATRYWGIQLEARAYPTSFFDGTRAVETLSFVTRALAPNDRYSITLVYRPHYAHDECSGDHNLVWWDADNRLYYDESAATFVLVVDGVAITSDAVTFDRHDTLTITIDNTVAWRRLVVSGCTTGNGTTKAAAVTPPSLPDTGYLFGDSSGVDEAVDLISINGGIGASTGAGFVAHALGLQIAVLGGGPRTESQGRM